MAALGTKFVTLADVAKSKDKQIGKVAEVLSQENEMLQDIPYTAMNEKTIHKEEIRSGLPAVYYRKANQAITASKSTTEERTFSAAHFESKSQIDAMVAARGGQDRVAYNRWNQAMGHLQAQAQELASLMIYGSPVTSNSKVAGLMDVYSSLSGETGKQVINGGSVDTDNTSILLVHWGERSVFGVYPEGTQYGIKRTDRSKGGQLVPLAMNDSAGNPGTVWGYEEQFEVDHGLVVKDYRQAARICNIDISDLAGDTGADLITMMIKASYKIQNPSNGKGVWYVNRTIQAFLHLQALTKVGAGAGLTFDNFEGKKILMFLGRPVRLADALLNTESLVS